MKKKKSSGGANWMDTYGDMVTLLLCFFVLLYSMSTISEESWKNLVMSFNPDAVQEALDDLGGKGPSADVDLGAGLVDVPSTNGEEETQEEIDDMIEELFLALQQYAAESGMSENIQVSKDGGKVYVTFGETAFFDGEKWEIRPDAYPILEAVSQILSHASPAIDQIRVQGHTAQAGVNPNNTRNDRFLASNRATNVLVYIQEHSTVDPARLVSEGFGQWQPVAPNTTAEGRAQNRRVELIISGRNLEEELAQQYSSETGGINMSTSAAGTSTEPGAD